MRLFGALLLLVALCLPLAGEASECITLTWTAPGDDSTTGIAKAYDIRFNNAPLTAENWHLATAVLNEPTPAVAGSREAVVLCGFESGNTYYFAIRSVDEAGNWSDLSNVSMSSPGGSCCINRVGNVNCDTIEKVDISDLTALTNYLFMDGTLCCYEEANINGDAQGIIDIVDLSRLVDHLFLSYDPLTAVCKQ